MIQWTINELITRYSLEPDLNDVFVEGVLDRDILSEASATIDSDTKFYNIDLVDVPAKLLSDHELSSGNKQRVIALALELERLEFTARVLCFVDTDLDRWLKGTISSAYLRCSTFTSIECHFLSHDAAKRMLTSIGSTAMDSISFFNDVVSILRQTFALRLASSSLNHAVRWIDFTRYLDDHQHNNTVSFRLDEYITNSLNSSGLASCRINIEQAFSEWLDRLTEDSRNCIRGHDYTNILAWIAKKFKGKREFHAATSFESMYILLARETLSLRDEIEQLVS